MGATKPDICGDPLFQLNLVLWSLLSSGEEYPIASPYGRSGYAVHTIGRAIPPGPKLQAAFRKYCGSVSPARPDVIADPVSANPWLIIECKRTGFSADSSTANQARKIISIKQSLLDTLAVPTGEGHVITLFLTRDHKADEFAETLDSLHREMAIETDPCSVSLAKVMRMSGGIGISIHKPKELGSPTSSGYLELSKIVPVEALILKCGDDLAIDPRLMYFIPFDPSIDYDDSMLSSKQEAKNSLLFRAAVASIAKIGREKAPSRVAIGLDELLSIATYGMSLFWNRDDLSILENLLAEYILRVVSGSYSPKPKALRNGRAILLTIASNEEKDAIIDALSQPLNTPMSVLEAAAAQTDLGLFES